MLTLWLRKIGEHAAGPSAGREGGSIRAPAFPDIAAQPGMIRLRIMATSDLHMNLRGYDYLADRPTAAGGLTRIATLVRELRATAPNTLLFDNGDLLQGTPMGDLFAGPAAPSPHPAIAALRVLGTDAATLGNHEFDYGFDTLQRILTQADFPVVCANMSVLFGGAGRQPARFAILKRRFRDTEGRGHELRIGVIGFLPPQLMRWNAHALAGRIALRDIVAAAREHVPQLREAGADIVIALCHSGIGPEAAVPGMEHAAVPLAAVPGIDALVMGHSHRVFPGPDYPRSAAVDPLSGHIHGKPATMPGFNGSHLGLLDLVLARRGNGWRVHAGRGSVLAVADSPAALAEDREVLAATEPAHAATLAHIRRPAGSSGFALHSHFALLGHAPALSVVLAAQARHAARALAGGPYAQLPLLSAASPLRNGGCGARGGPAGVPAGPVLRRHVAALYGFPNRLVALLLDGATLRDWLERSAAIFRQVRPESRAAPLLHAGAPAYNFDVIAGLEYVIDLSRPALFAPDGSRLADTRGTGRITSLSHDGRPVDPEDRFVLVTNSYRAGGGGGFPTVPGAAAVHVSDETMEQILLSAFADDTARAGPLRPLFRFAPMPGTQVVFETEAAAGPYAEEMPWLRLSPGMPGDDGRLRYTLEL